MDTYFGAKAKTRRLIDLVREREIKESTGRVITQKSNVTEDFVSRLGLEKELEGHKGCVNCLEWSDSGQSLASASDDMQIFLWNAFSHKKLCSFDTGHVGNIFSVKFMPKSNENIVASGAADARVKVFNLSLTEVLFSCSCHVGRVKRIATVDSTPFLLWSAAEDGLVLQHDLRTPHNCSTDQKRVLIDLIYHTGRTAEAKCIAVNRARPELVAVGANDAYIRIYDRRMIKLGRVPGSGSSRAVPPSAQRNEQPADESAPQDGNDETTLCVAQYLIAGHLRAPQHGDGVRSYAATYVTFSADGTELLANIRGENIYLFDIMKPRKNRLLFNVPQPIDEHHEDMNLLTSSAYGTDSTDTKDYTLINTKVLPDHVEDIKKQANNKFQLDKYIAATELYNKALGYCPTASVLYGNRAAALMKRKWEGDVYAALRDCQTTLLLDPDHVKAHFRLARCLFELDRHHEAYRVIQDFEEAFPDYANNSAHRALKEDITRIIKSGGTASSYEDDDEALSVQERACRRATLDYKLRYCGHCNSTTDIKEANFFGNDGQYIIAGSDDGNIFIWDRHTTNIVRILRGDRKVVNCLQPHPSSCFIATSGIDSVIRLWSPLPEDGQSNKRHVKNHEVTATANQARMRSDPFELMLMNMGYGEGRQAAAARAELNDPTIDDDEAEEEDQRDTVVIRGSNCRPS